MEKITIDDKIIQEIKELSANKEFMAEVEALRQRAINAHLELGDSVMIDLEFDNEAERLAKSMAYQSSVYRILTALFL